MKPRTFLPHPLIPICLGLASGIVRADEPAAKPGDDSAVALESMTVTASRETDQLVTDYKETSDSVATKTSTPLLETPQAISIISRDQMDLRNAKTVAEALRYTASVTTDAYGEDPRGYDWLNIRGFEAFNSQYLDGLRLTNYELTESFGLERVEVMKGPASVLYGQSTPGGLANGVSKRPRETAFGEVSAEIGTGESYELTFDQGAPVDKDGKILYRLTALFRDANEDSNGSVIDAQRVFVAPSVTWKISEDTKLTVLASYFYGESTQFPSFVADANGDPTGVLLNNKSLDYETNEIFRIGYQFEHRINTDLVFRQNTRFSSYDVEDGYLNVLAPATSAKPDRVRRTASVYNSDSRAFATDNQLEWKTSGGRLEQTVLAGVDFGYSSADSEYFEDKAPKLILSAPDYSVHIPRPTTLLSQSRQQTTQTGIYAQDQLKLDSHWVATLSGRHDWVYSKYGEDLYGGSMDEQKDSAFSGRAGFLYLADNGLAPYASYSSGFYPNSGAGYGGVPFDPTESTQYELGVKYAPKDFRGGATLSVYDLTQTNVVTADAAHTGFDKASGEWASRGVEFEGNLGITSNIDWLASASFSKVEITKSKNGDEGNVPGQTPEVTASTWLNYTFRDNALNGLTLGSGIRYQGSSYADSSNLSKNDGTIAFDLAARYTRGAWTYALNFNNIFDDVEKLYDGVQFTNTAGSSASLSVAYHW